MQDDNVDCWLSLLMLNGHEISCIYIFVFEPAYFNLQISCIFKTLLRGVILAPSNIQQKGLGA